MKVISIAGSKARADFSGLKKDIDIRFIEGIRPGDYVIVHAGFAIEKLNAEEAERTLKMIREIEKTMTKENHIF